MVYKPLPGESIHTTAERMRVLAEEQREVVKTTFNTIEVTASPGDTTEAIVGRYHAICDQRRKEYESTPQFAEEQRRLEKSRQDAKDALDAALKDAPARIELRNELIWKDFLGKNVDPYSARTLEFAEQWARLMQAQVAKGERVKDVAGKMADLADHDGLSGYMRSMATEILGQVWVYGDALWDWRREAMMLP